MRNMYITEVSEDSTSGETVWEVDADDAAEILEWLDGDVSQICDYEELDDGGFQFSTGAQYSLFDQDLLGGNGDGQTEKRFTEETGIILRMQ